MLNPSQQLIRLGFGFMISQALNAAADLNIADRLAAGERSVDDLAAETGCRADALYRIMRVLAAEGIFRETVDRRFELTELGWALCSGRPCVWRPWAAPVRDPDTISPPLRRAIRPASRRSDGAGWCGESFAAYRVRGRELLRLCSSGRGRLYSEEGHSRLE